MTTPVMDLFSHDFSFWVMDEIPTNLPVWYFPGGSKVSGRDGVLVRVDSPKTDPWVGMFAFGRGEGAVTGIYTCPDKSKMLVVARGNAVFVSAHEPLVSHESVPLDSIKGVFPAPEINVIAMHDFARFVAYGETGIVWRTPALSWDLVSSVSKKDSKLVGLGWSAPDQAKVEFEIDLLTGEFTGGTSPELLGGS